MIADHGQCDMVYGVMGGAYQAAGHAHFVTNVLDFEMDVQAAIDAPRLFHFDGRIEAEDGFGDSVLEELRARGHAVAKANMPWGGGQAIRIDRARGRSEEHTSELQSLMRISYAVFCLKTKNILSYKIN